MPRKQTVLYHYTSIDALYNIVSSKTFWLANAKSSNDKTENALSIKKFKSILEEISYVITNKTIKNAIEDFVKYDDKSWPNEDNKFYILSLTNKRDNLAHWDRYSDRRCGASIGIKSTLLQKIDNIFHSKFRGDMLKQYDVIYSNNKCIKATKKEINIYLQRLKHECIDDAYIMNAHMFIFIYAMYIKNMSLMKHVKFSDEFENRIVLHESILKYFKNSPSFKMIKDPLFSLIKSLDIEETYFAPIRGEIRSLHHLCLKDIWGSDLIPEIMLGPNCPQSKDELRYFLDEHGLKDTKITESEIPIR